MGRIRANELEQFHSVFRSLAEHYQPAKLEDELLREIFTANMIDQEIQKELLKTTLTPEKALELAVSIELGIRSQLAIQARQPLDASATPFIGREEPVMEISSFRGSSRPSSTPRGMGRGNDRGMNNNNRASTTTAGTADNPGIATTEQSAKPSAKRAADATNRTTMRRYADPI